MSTLELTRDGSWLTIALNRPEARNAMSAEMVIELMQVLEETAKDRAIRGITFRGNGGTFCAGGDLKGFKQDFQGSGPDVIAVEAASLEVGALFNRIATMPQVTVMLVEGAAMAGGLGMVCAGDIVAVRDDAKFGLTEVMLGIPPAQIAPYVVARLGMRVAKRLMLTAARFDGKEALTLGLADYVCENMAALEQIETDIRTSVLRCAPNAIAVTKDIILATQTLDGDALRQKAAQGFAACMLGSEGREGIASFIEKRKPEWVV